jgi:hypothetical protein
MKFKSGDIIKSTGGQGHLRIVLLEGDTWYIIRPTMLQVKDFVSTTDLQQFNTGWEKVGNIHEVLKEVEEEDE